MGEPKQMPKLDIQKDKPQLKQSQIDYMKLLEKQNAERVLKLQKLRRTNVITGTCLGIGVLSIYFYSIFAVKQEKFLDDFEDPNKPVSSNSKL